MTSTAGAARSGSGTPLRRRLVVLTAAGVLPLALMAGTSLYALQAQQRAQAERVGVELARSVANAVDAELRSAVAVLETLATTPVLDGEDLPGFRARAQRVLGSRPAWAAILLTDGVGNPLVDTRTAGRSPLAPDSERASFDRVIRTRRPVVGSLQRHGETGWVFAVRVPVLRGPSIKYVVTALILPEAIRDVLQRQRVPSEWVISIVDENGLRVARSRAHDENLGGRLSETAQRIVDAGAADEGFGVSYTLEGERIFTPYGRLVSSGWVAVLGFPTALVDAAVTRALALYGGGILLSIALGTLGSLWVARTITRPIGDLRDAAEALGRRQALPPPATGIQEIRDVGVALRAAAEDLARAEARQQDLLQKERHAREAAEWADRTKDEFMAVLSHELRTPLNAVYGWAKMLEGGQLSEPATREGAVQAIVRNAHMQVQLIEDLLDLSRITTGKLRLDIRQVQLPAVLRDAVEAVRPAADAKGIRIDTRLGADDDALVNGDPARLQQVVWNLLMNAIKFSPRGGAIQLALAREDAQQVIVVHDSGQGIAPDILPHVFERFRQGDSSSTRRHGGLGLGLALVKHLVELHGGTVTAASPGEGRGATFTVALPTAVAAPDEESRASGVAPQSVSAASPGITRLDRLRVVVVDDDNEGLVLAETILAGAGAEVRTAGSAAAGLALLQHWRPDVLVSDIEMPGEDGYSLIRKVRALPPGDGGRIPAIALTAYGRVQDRDRSAAEGYDRHVSKPVDPVALTTIVAALAGLPRPVA